MRTPLLDPVALAEAYGAAWNAHDIDAIMALHTVDVVFENVVTGDVFEGGAAVREFARTLFSTWPDIAFATRRLHTGQDLFVNEWTASATHTTIVRRGDRVAEPTGQRVVWNGVDVVPTEDGLVKRKIIYPDSVGFLGGLGLL